MEPLAESNLASLIATPYFIPAVEPRADITSEYLCSLRTAVCDMFENAKCLESWKIVKMFAVV